MKTISKNPKHDSCWVGAAAVGEKLERLGYQEGIKLISLHNGKLSLTENDFKRTFLQFDYSYIFTEKPNNFIPHKTNEKLKKKNR